MVKRYINKSSHLIIIIILCVSIVGCSSSKKQHNFIDNMIQYGNQIKNEVQIITEETEQSTENINKNKSNFNELDKGVSLYADKIKKNIADLQEIKNLINKLDSTQEFANIKNDYLRYLGKQIDGLNEIEEGATELHKALSGGGTTDGATNGIKKMVSGSQNYPNAYKQLSSLDSEIRKIKDAGYKK
jgi:uncharacterized phage infection (PIP) family protein YhgE